MIPTDINEEPCKRMKKRQTFFQHRRGIPPTLLEVLNVEKRIGHMDICKVRWHIIGKDQISTSAFLMAAKDGEFMDFVPIRRAIYQQAIRVLKDLKKSIAEQEVEQNAPIERAEKLRLNRNAKRRVLRLIDKNKV